jgi:hypothetical protein
MKFKSTAAAVATFGAAAATMYISPSAEAGIINLTPNLPGPFSGTLSNWDIGLGGSSNDFGQWNDGVGKTLNPGTDPNGIAGWRFAQTSSNINANDAFSTYLGIGTNFGGVQMFGFRTGDGNVGWMQIDFGAGGAGTAINYLAAAYEDSGRAIHAGSFAAVPEPATLGLTALGLLAAGAAGKRRKAAAVATS